MLAQLVHTLWLPNTLQEILTIKSDDVIGRSKAYESIIKGEEIKGPRVPESFNVLVKELQSLGLAVDLERSKLATSIDAEEVLAAQTDAEVKELADEELLVGESAAEGEAIVDLTDAGGGDDFAALAEAELTKDIESEEV